MYDISINLFDRTKTQRFSRPDLQLVSGVDTVLQKFILFILTDIQSDKLASDNYGSDLALRLKYNMFQTEAQFVSWFQEVATRFITWLESTYTDTTPNTEKVSAIELISFNVADTTITLEVGITTPETTQTRVIIV